MESRHDVKSTLQAMLDAGEIANMRQLLNHIEANGFRITRNGCDYVGLLRQDGSRFRVRFTFPNDTRPVALFVKYNESATEAPQIVPAIASVKGSWIYALLAHSRDGLRKACYIGQTVNLTRRFRQHHQRRAPGASFALSVWAGLENVEVRGVALGFIEGSESIASRFEGYWLKLALDAGYEAPDVDNWGRLPLPNCKHNYPDYWPEYQIVTASLPLSDLVMLVLPPSRVLNRSC